MKSGIDTKNFECAICQEIMDEPVETSDRQCYDRYCIEEWFLKGRRTSPLTGENLKDTELKEVSFAFKSEIEKHLTPEIRAHKKQYKKALLLKRLDILRDKYVLQVERIGNLYDQDKRDDSFEDLVLGDYHKFMLFLKNAHIVVQLCDIGKSTFSELWQLKFARLEHIFRNIDNYRTTIAVYHLTFSEVKNFSDEQIKWYIFSKSYLEKLAKIGISWQNFTQIKSHDQEKGQWMMNHLYDVSHILLEYRFDWSYIHKTPLEKLEFIFAHGNRYFSLITKAEMNWNLILLCSLESLKLLYEHFAHIIMLIEKNVISPSELVHHPKLSKILAVNSSFYQLKHLIHITEFVELSETQQRWVFDNNHPICIFFEKCTAIPFMQFASLPLWGRKSALANPTTLNKLSPYIDINALLQMDRADINYVIENPGRVIAFCKQQSPQLHREDKSAIGQGKDFIAHIIRELKWQGITVPDEFIQVLQGYGSNSNPSPSPSPSPNPNPCAHRYVTARYPDPFATISDDHSERLPLLWHEEPEQERSVLTSNQKYLCGTGLGLGVLGGSLWILFATGVIKVSASAGIVTLLTVGLPVTVTTVGVALLVGTSIYAYKQYKDNDYTEESRPTV